ncbi:hypothetical protein RND61_23660 [Streptomyces sp. TRM76323]|uniref:Uncharacterized protein n=1 Tax=Streptomyces tamarix TaxID=3078565 RepID=A0ABU3QQL9_9ACTN|nr:hypothetical protein [Streptomyces tamarix]MDT9685032.1 hypothetical protein [Streptomyces tamarix]
MKRLAPSSPNQQTHLPLELAHPDARETAWRFLPTRGINQWQIGFAAETPVEVTAGAAP